jgi:hypothetical protein
LRLIISPRALLRWDAGLVRRRWAYLRIFMDQPSEPVATQDPDACARSGWMRMPGKPDSPPDHLDRNPPSPTRKPEPESGFKTRIT